MELPSEIDGPYCQCFYCGINETSAHTLKRCSGCQLVSYCCKECQEFDWREHKHICKKFPVVNGKNVYHTSEPWEKHIAWLREQAAQLPIDSETIKSTFGQPKVCKTCHEPQPDRLKVCKCNVVCYCSEKCAKKDKVHKRSCNKIASMMSSWAISDMRRTYPASFHNFLIELINSRIRLSFPIKILDMQMMRIHIVTNTAYTDAAKWDSIFRYFPKMLNLHLTFIVQNVPYDESLNCYQKQMSGLVADPRKCITTYSVYQMPYHMYFSSSDYTEADFVVTYGISDPKYDAHNKISYRNMTNYTRTVLILMDSTKELVTQAVEDVKEAQPTSILLLPPQRNRARGFGGTEANISQMKFHADARNVKCYMAGLHRPSGEVYIDS